MPQGVEIRAPIEGRAAEILTEEALAFLAGLHREFEATRAELLRRREERQERIRDGEMPGFLKETQEIRADDGWKVVPPPPDLRDRRVEITGPTDRKMIINALNSGAKVFMADFEDANSPTWENMTVGQANLIDAVERTIDFTSEEGKEYRLADETATLVVRPRGWHLPENHVLVDETPISGSLFDFGLYFFHNADRLLHRGTGPYFYLPKLESHVEARLWNDVFVYAQDALGIARGTIRATVLVETVLAAFEMDEILYELRDHSAGLNAGRWDYIFSLIKKFRDREDFVLPDRAQVAMTVPFMRAYTELLVKTCHRRDGHAIGGMAAFIPSRKDRSVNETALVKVREDKVRESGDGFDGTWVAHPDLVEVAREPFDDVLGDRPHQIDRKRDDVTVTEAELLDIRVPGGTITEGGLRGNVNIGVQYLSAWLRGNGAAAILNLMEDTATAEIARSQVWQWVRHRAVLDDGRRIGRDLVQAILEEELEKIQQSLGAEAFEHARAKEARALFEEVALAEEFVEFLTLPGSDYLD
ncbi:MAG: malate synthase A [Actinomycetota bacterium]